MELAQGALAGGRRYIAVEPLLARRAPQVTVGPAQTYGMGLIVDTTYDVPVIHHGGDMIAYRSDMIWLPEHGIGAVILTSSDAAAVIRDLFRRKLLELVFDASRTHPDGSVSWSTITPGMAGLEFSVGAGPPRTLTLRDAQHAYTFTER